MSSLRVSPRRSSDGIRGFTLLSLVYCTFTLIAQSAYQITEKVIRPDEVSYHRICNNTGIEWLRYTGLIRFKGDDQFESARTIMPEIVAFIFSALTFLLVNLLSHRSEELDTVGDVQQIRDGAQSPTSGPEATRRPLVQLSMSLRRLSNVLIIILAAVIGSIQPSLLSLLYFLCFLFISTWWSLYKPLRHGTYNKIKWVRSPPLLIPPSSDYPRLVGGPSAARLPLPDPLLPNVAPAE